MYPQKRNVACEIHAQLKSIVITKPLKCIYFSESIGPLGQTSVPGIVALALGLSILSALLCLIGRLFSGSLGRSGDRFGDAGQNGYDDDVEAEAGGSRRASKTAVGDRQQPPQITLQRDNGE